MSESVKVVVRCRPLSTREKDNGHGNVVDLNCDQARVTIRDPTAPDAPKTFTFDSTFDITSTQEQVYNLTARPIVESVLKGYNGTIFAYGQTGTGKTFTMEGVRETPELRGIIPNAIRHIFQHIRSSSGINFLVRASYLEIYNEDIHDLLNPKVGKLDIKERPDVGVYVKDLQSFVIKDEEEMDRLMAYGNKNRSVGATLMNERSSRSHSIFTITVEASELDENGMEHIRAGKLHLVDLAGSERQSKTGATGDRLKEATKINLSLSALGNVISALVDGKATHIPYRDSKLTRLLQDSLGGNAKTLMIATLSPASYNYDESLSTLRYANRAKNIKNKPHINEDPKDALLRQFQEEIKRLREQLAALDNGTIVNEETQGQSDKPTKSSEKSPKKKSKAQQAQPATEEELMQRQQKLEDEKQMILASKNMEESEKLELLKQLEQRSKELEAERDMRNQLVQQLKQLEKQLLVGNVNLLDKEAKQRELLAQQAMELEEQNRRERELQRQLEESENAKIQIEGHYTTLQEEALAKTKKIKKLWTMLTNVRNEVNDSREEHQREREDLQETIGAIQRELKLCTLVINQIIPDEYQKMIERAAVYDDNTESWRIAHVSHAGNNVRNSKSLATNKLMHLVTKQGHADENESPMEEEGWRASNVFPNVYLSYEDPKLVKRITSSKPRKPSGAVLGPRPLMNPTSASSFRTIGSSSPKKSAPGMMGSPERVNSSSSVASFAGPIPSSATQGRAKTAKDATIPVARGLVQKPVRYG